MSAQKPPVAITIGASSGVGLHATLAQLPEIERCRICATFVDQSHQPGVLCRTVDTD